MSEFIAVVHQMMYSFIALVSIINPLASAGVFLANTRGIDAEIRRDMALKIGLYGFLFLSGVILAGNPVLTFFGLKLRFVEAGGGMVILYSAWGVLMSDGKTASAEPENHGNVLSKVFVPLTFPFTVGPGACAVALGLAARIHNYSKISDIAVQYLAVIAAAALACICVWLVFRYIDVISRALGKTGTQVAVKLLMFLLLCMGLEMIYEGLVVMS